MEQSKCVCASILKRTLAMDGDGGDGLMAQSVSAPPTLATLRSISRSTFAGLFQLSERKDPAFDGEENATPFESPHKSQENDRSTFTFNRDIQVRDSIYCTPRLQCGFFEVTGKKNCQLFQCSNKRIKQKLCGGKLSIQILAAYTTTRCTQRGLLGKR